MFRQDVLTKFDSHSSSISHQVVDKGRQDMFAYLHRLILSVYLDI